MRESKKICCIVKPLAKKFLLYMPVFNVFACLFSFFRQVVILISEAAGIDSGIVEKDYYVTMFLKLLAEKQPQIILKGGTSLSKCHNLIKRFSEDIDLSLECETRPTEGQRRHLKENIISTVNDFGFELTNLDKVCDS